VLAEGKKGERKGKSGGRAGRKCVGSPQSAAGTVSSDAICHREHEQERAAKERALKHGASALSHAKASCPLQCLEEWWVTYRIKVTEDTATSPRNTSEEDSLVGRGVSPFA